MIGGLSLRMVRIKEDYVLANCCRPEPNTPIIGYHSHTTIIKVHAAGCPNLDKAEPERLISLVWEDIIAKADFTPDADYERLDYLDFKILAHHDTYGFDYSNKVAAILGADRKSIHDAHAKLRDLKLLERVDPKMIQYRKNIVPGKWIKHRNHTYYSLTDKGRAYLACQKKDS